MFIQLLLIKFSSEKCIKLPLMVVGDQSDEYDLSDRFVEWDLLSWFL